MERLTRICAFLIVGAVSIVLLGCSAPDGGNTQTGAMDSAATLAKQSQGAPPPTEAQKKILSAAIGAGHGGGGGGQMMGNKKGSASAAPAATGGAKPVAPADN